MSELINTNNNNVTESQNSNLISCVEINQLYLELDEFIFSNVHINLFKNCEVIYQTNDPKKNVDIILLNYI